MVSGSFQLLLCAINLTLVTTDVNFELLFKSNSDTFDGFPVRAELPLPRWLKGEYIRNGFGQFEMGDRHVEHAFDAFAKLCKFSFNGSDLVYFSSRLLQSNYMQDSTKQHTIAPYLLFDSPVPKFSALERVKALVHGVDNTNVNIVPIKQDGSINSSWALMAVSDFWQMYEFDRESLQTKGRIDPVVPMKRYINEHLPLPLPSSAHPVPEYETTNLISYVSLFDIRPWGQNSINIIRIKTNKDRELIASIPVKSIPYMHSLGVSKKYAIILAHPLSVNLWRMVKTSNPFESLDWKPEKHTQIYVVNLLSGKLHIIKSQIKAKFNMHHINSYQISGKRLIVDYVAYPDVKFLKGFKMNILYDKQKRNQVETQAELLRYVIDLNSNSAEMRIFEPTIGLEFANTMDMPAINELYRYKKHCFVYGVAIKSDNVTMSNTTLVKKNLCKGGRDKVWMETNHYVSEPWFVQKPDGVREDDGILLSLILDGNKATSYLGVLDARTMKMINRLYLPSFVPFTLHGRFLDYDFLHGAQ